MSSPRGRNTVVLIILLVIVSALVLQFRSSQAQPVRMNFNEFADAVKAGEVKSVTVDENELEVTFRDGLVKYTRKEADKPAVEQLLELGVRSEDLASNRITWEIKAPSDWNTVISLITYLLPGLLALIAVGGLIPLWLWVWLLYR